MNGFDFIVLACFLELFDVVPSWLNLVPTISRFSVELGSCNFLALLENPKVEKKEDERELSQTFGAKKEKKTKTIILPRCYYILMSFLENPAAPTGSLLASRF